MMNLLGPQTPGPARPGVHVTLPAELADVALVDAKIAAAVGGMSVSWWHEKVASGEAPQPAIRAPRCTRWRAADVRRFWVKFAAHVDQRAAEQVTALAAKATRAAHAQRQAARVEA